MTAHRTTNIIMNMMDGCLKNMKIYCIKNVGHYEVFSVLIPLIIIPQINTFNTYSDTVVFILQYERRVVPALLLPSYIRNEFTGFSLSLCYVFKQVLTGCTSDERHVQFNDGS